MVNVMNNHSVVRRNFSAAWLAHYSILQKAHVLLFLFCLFVPVAGGCHRSSEMSGRGTERHGPTGKPLLVGTWRGEVLPDSNVEMEFTFRRNGQVLTGSPLTDRQHVTFWLSRRDNDTLFMRHVLESSDDGPEVRIQMVNTDTITMEFPSELAQTVLKSSGGASTIQLTRVAGTTPERGPPLKLPSRARRIVGAWEHQHQPPLGPTVQIDFMPDGTMYSAMFVANGNNSTSGLLSLMGGHEGLDYQETTGTWKLKEVDGQALILELTGDETSQVRLTFQNNDRITIAATDGSQETTTYRRIARLID